MSNHHHNNNKNGLSYVLEATEFTQVAELVRGAGESAGGGSLSAVSTHRSCYSFCVIAGLIRIFPLVFALAGLVQSSLAGAHQAAALENQAKAMEEQPTKRETEANLATIIQSGSTNTAAYKVVIHNDGSATAIISGGLFAFRNQPPRSRQFPSGTVDVRTLRRLLSEIGDVSKIPVGDCPKSVSFGTRTQISYAGKTSGDLQCIKNPTSGGNEANLQACEHLSRFVQTTLHQLKVNASRISSNP